ncbi:MAG: hypothetical protein K0Q94_5747 [Paenibacillus sp.]|nr:hypothetical protein [Paenibacillus sp.]
MNYGININEGKAYLVCDSAETPLRTEQDALDLIAASYEHNVKHIMLHADVLSEDFFKLGTGLAGSVLQKFVNNQVKVAAIVPSDRHIGGRAKEMLDESNKGNDFKVFADISEAEKWLLSQ